MPRKGLSHEMSMAVDRYANAVTVITENHRMIHDGYFFSAGLRDASLANDAVINMLLTVPAGTYPHFQALYLNADGGGFTIELFEDTLTSADGTVVTPVNKNRNSTFMPKTIITHTPTITDDGDLLELQLVPDGTGVPQAVLWDDRAQGEYVLKPSTKYLLRVTNISGQARDVQMVMTGYEIGQDH